MKMEKAVMLINDTTYAFNLRGAVIEKLIDEDFEVVIVGQLLKHQDKLKAIGNVILMGFCVLVLGVLLLNQMDNITNYIRFGV